MKLFHTFIAIVFLSISTSAQNLSNEDIFYDAKIRANRLEDIALDDYEVNKKVKVPRKEMMELLERIKNTFVETPFISIRLAEKDFHGNDTLYANVKVKDANIGVMDDIIFTFRCPKVSDVRDTFNYYTKMQLPEDTEVDYAFDHKQTRYGYIRHSLTNTANNICFRDEGVAVTFFLQKSTLEEREMMSSMSVCPEIYPRKFGKPWSRMMEKPNSEKNYSDTVILLILIVFVIWGCVKIASGTKKYMFGD